MFKEAIDSTSQVVILGIRGVSTDVFLCASVLLGRLEILLGFSTFLRFELDDMQKNLND